MVSGGSDNATCQLDHTVNDLLLSELNETSILDWSRSGSKSNVKMSVKDWP